MFNNMNKTWIVTIKEKGNPNPITTSYTGECNYEFVKKFFGCDQPDVEWYLIEEEWSYNSRTKI